MYRKSTCKKSGNAQTTYTAAKGSERFGGTLLPDWPTTRGLRPRNYTPAPLNAYVPPYRYGRRGHETYLINRL